MHEYFFSFNVILFSVGKIDQEVMHRVRKANQISRTLVAKQVSKEAKLRIFRSVFLPVLLYGDERWVLLDKNASRVMTTEMRYLRRVAGKTRQEQNN